MTVEKNVNKYFIKALVTRYLADMDAAEAGIRLYLSESNQAAIGEHSDLLSEIDNFVQKYTEANDKLSTLKLLIDGIES